MARRFHNQTVVVAGMGKSGFAAADVLIEHGATVRAVDEKPDEGMRARLAEKGIELRAQGREAFAGADLIVLSPGVPVEAAPAGIPVIGELELASYYLQGPVIGITGSNGKTTTTALTGHVLRESGIACQVGGNIGTPPTAMIATSRADQWNVLELSSFQLETIHEFRADAGACLNITQNHLDRHGTMRRYIDAKARLAETMDESGHLVLNRDNELSAAFAGRTRAHIVWFSMAGPTPAGFWLRGEEIVSDGGSLMNIREVRLRGRHNLENVMAAAALCRIAGAPLAAIRDGVGTFAGVEHRIEFVRNVRGVEYYNDSKATSVDAALKAVDAFGGGLWIILGGKDKGSDYTPMREPLRQKARAALLVGAASEKIAGHLEGALPVVQCGDIEQAVRTAHAHATPGDIVLLAPACASFDQFRSYEHRGEFFKQTVAKLEE